jgi:hypothetical protein
MAVGQKVNRGRWKQKHERINVSKQEILIYEFVINLATTSEEYESTETQNVKKSRYPKIYLKLNQNRFQCLSLSHLNNFLIRP